MAAEMSGRTEPFGTMIALKDEVPRRLKIIAISFAAWSGIAALFALQRLYSVVARGVAPMWDSLALDMIITWGTWALLTPLIMFIVRRLPLPSEQSWRALWHLPIGIGIGLLHSLLVAIIMPLFIWRPSFEPIKDMFRGRLANAIAFETLIYFLVIAVLYALIYASQSRERRIAFEKAESGLARAQLDVTSLEEKRQQLVSRLNEISSRDVDADCLVVPERDGLLKLPLRSIDWLQAEDNYVRVHAGGRSHLLRTTLGALERRLAANDFVRIHRSAVVNVSRVSRLRRLGRVRFAVVLTTGAQLRVSRACQARVVAAVRGPLTPA